eukprot:98114_1
MNTIISVYLIMNTITSSMNITSFDPLWSRNDVITSKLEFNCQTQENTNKPDDLNENRLDYGDKSDCNYLFQNLYLNINECNENVRDNEIWLLSDEHEPIILWIILWIIALCYCNKNNRLLFTCLSCLSFMHKKTVVYGKRLEQETIELSTNYCLPDTWTMDNSVYLDFQLTFDSITSPDWLRNDYIHILDIGAENYFSIKYQLFRQSFEFTVEQQRFVAEYAQNDGISVHHQIYINQDLFNWKIDGIVIVDQNISSLYDLLSNQTICFGYVGNSGFNKAVSGRINNFKIATTAAPPSTAPTTAPSYTPFTFIYVDIYKCDDFEYGIQNIYDSFDFVINFIGDEAITTFFARTSISTSDRAECNKVTINSIDRLRCYIQSESIIGNLVAINLNSISNSIICINNVDVFYTFSHEENAKINIDSADIQNITNSPANNSLWSNYTFSDSISNGIVLSDGGCEYNFYDKIDNVFVQCMESIKLYPSIPRNQIILKMHTCPHKGSGLTTNELQSLYLQIIGKKLTGDIAQNSYENNKDWISSDPINLLHFPRYILESGHIPSTDKFYTKKK